MDQLTFQSPAQVAAIIPGGTPLHSQGVQSAVTEDKFICFATKLPRHSGLGGFAPLIFGSCLFKKTKQTLRIVKQNLTLALGVIVLATTPALLGLVPLWMAVILHEGGTVLAGLNSLRLLKK